MDVRFENPVFVADGPGLIREINTPTEALDFLDEWPDDDRSFTYDAAVEACRSALTLQTPISVARFAFSKWARDNGLLEEVSVPPWMTPPRSGRGGIPA